VASVTKPFPPAPLAGEVSADAEGFLTVTAKGIAEDFAQDLSDEEKQLLTSTQVPQHRLFLETPSRLRVEDQAVLERDCQQRPRCSSGAREGRSYGNEGYFDHSPLRSRSNAFSPQRNR